MDVCSIHTHTHVWRRVLLTSMKLIVSHANQRFNPKLWSGRAEIKNVMSREIWFRSSYYSQANQESTGDRGAPPRWRVHRVNPPRSTEYLESRRSGRALRPSSVRRNPEPSKVICLNTVSWVELKESACLSASGGFGSGGAPEKGSDTLFVCVCAHSSEWSQHRRIIVWSRGDAADSSGSCGVGV